MPERNSGAKAASTGVATPSALRPAAVNATYMADVGGGCMVTAVVTGAVDSQARAAATSRILSRAYEA